MATTAPGTRFAAISAAKKSDGWFFHAITGERWLVKLKFRTAKRTFERDTLIAQLGLKPLNDLDEIEAYGHGPRVKCKNLRGPWQEVQIDVINEHTQALRGMRYTEVWRYDAEHKRWWVTSGLPDFWAGQ